MTDQTNILPAPYLTRAFWASISAIVFTTANQVGLHLDPVWLSNAPDILLNIASAFAAGYAIYSHLAHKKSVTKDAISATVPTPSTNTGTTK